MLVFLIIIILLAIILQYMSMKNALRGINYNYTCTKHLVEPDEVFDVVTTLTNQSSRFIPFVRLSETIPFRVKVLHSQAKLSVDIGNNLLHISTTYLLPKSKLDRRLPVSISKRGCYRFRGADVSCGDFLGLEETTERFYIYNNEVVVYPKEAQTDNLHNMFGGFFGDMSVRRFMMEDPVLTVSAREYTGCEPLKQISWNHSARVGKLMVKQFDYTVEPVVSVMLDVNTDNTMLVENCFCLTRTVCQLLETKRIAYDFITNASTCNAISRWSYVGEGLGSVHFLSILEGLGRASCIATEPFFATVDKMKKKQYKNRSLIIIMPARDDGKHQAANHLQELTLKFVYGEDCLDDIHNDPETHM